MLRLLLLEYLRHFLDRFGWCRPKAGSIAFPALLEGSVDALCAGLVETAGVLLVPGSLYGRDYNAFRIGFGRKDMPACLQLFDEYLRAN